ADPRDVGGVMYDLGAHLVDQALVLFGPASGVYAERRVLRPGAQVDDECFIALTHENGVQSHLSMSLLCAAPGPRFRVLGAEAAFVKYGLDPQEEALRAGAVPGGADWGAEPEAQFGALHQGETRRIIASARGDYPALYTALARAIQTGAAAPVAAAEAIAALHILEAAAQSARTGETISLRASG
ncbi:MAG TPA: Gfo/Idh/MocA family oxidoreductase, partial [Terricaulis sp.]|nr:Gfo/Idh/MocA family oxidoreductase [Terricaulis sp.]